MRLNAARSRDTVDTSEIAMTDADGAWPSSQGLKLVHFSSQSKHLLRAAHLQFSVRFEHCLWARLCV